jgi:hypothetical protein
MQDEKPQFTEGEGKGGNVVCREFVDRRFPIDFPSSQPTAPGVAGCLAAHWGSGRLLTPEEVG